MLATHFPKPDNPLMGNWALAQARALARQDLDLRVISPTSWVPPAFALSVGAKAYAHCPESFDWNGVFVHYPRWLWYPIPPLKRWEYTYPFPFLQVAWHSIKRRLLDVCRQFRPDVVYAHHTAVNGYIAMQLKVSCGIPYIVTDHGYGEISDCRHLESRKCFFNSIVANAYCMVGVSRRMTTTLKELFPLANARTVHNGTDPIPKHVLNRTAEPDKIVIFSCGAFSSQKAFPLLIDAFAMISAKYPHTILRIAGDGDERSVIERRIQDYHLNDRVVLLGFLSHDEVLREMVWSDIFALLSHDESFGVVYAEALSARKPIVCCSDAGITDIVRDHREGLVVPSGDRVAGAVALEELITDEELRERLGEAGRNLFDSNLTWDHNARTMATLLYGAAQRPSTTMIATFPTQ
jgi:glycosyltransferase involved in cell wall biosynthesis